MGHQLFDRGEELVIKEHFTEEVSKPASVTVGLYNDATDDLQESDEDPDNDISTEPDDGDYSRLTVDYGDVDMESAQIGGDWTVELTDAGADLSFDVGGTTGTVDSYFVVVNWDGTDYLFFNGPLSQSYDLGDITGSLNVENAGGSLS